MNPYNAFYKLFYFPICRVYARYLGDKPADSIMLKLCAIQFLRVNRYCPNFLNPRSFSEKIWNRMLIDRSPIMTQMNDKYEVRKYITKKVGSKYLIPLIWHGESPCDIPYPDLPAKFVIKMNHGCGYNIFVRNKEKIKKEQIKHQLKKWSATNFGLDTFLGVAWGYKNIKPIIMIEELLLENDNVPMDIKCWCYSGKIDFISLHFDRFKKHTTLSLNREFEPGGLNFGLPLYEGNFTRPSNYKEIIEVVETLAGDFDFIRIDLFNIEEKIYINELTVYPGGVSVKFEPRSLDFLIGKKWKSRKAHD